MNYKITVIKSGAELGIYSGDTPRAAYLAMLSDAGSSEADTSAPREDDLTIQLAED